MSKFRLFAILILSAAVAACSAETPPPDQPPTVNPDFNPGPTAATNDLLQINILSNDVLHPFPEMILGTNVPAWLGADTLSNPAFQTRAAQSGATIYRLPGGSWSNYYDWLACERDGQGIDQAAECFWPWAAAPSDFIPLFQNAAGQAMYTVNANSTAQEAAALVAFFNGQPESEAIIGPDRLGRDWGTVGRWAQLRVDQGYPEPLNIAYWEIGNEFYGGNEGSGTDCTPFGWEDVWTCDGREYVLGTADHDGFLTFYEAMKAVDPTIQIGAIGVAGQAEWSNWGNEVIAEAGEVMDFYIIHQYGFFEPPADLEEILRQPPQIWPDVMSDYRAALTEQGVDRDIPVAVTEYNLFSFQENDSQQLMTRAVNALYLADSIGQMAVNGVQVANQWNLANGQAENGTDYGLIQADTFDLNPQYFVFPMWDSFGSTLLATEITTPTDDLSVYAGQVDSDTFSLLVINKSDQPVSASLLIDGIAPADEGEADILSTLALDSQDISWNGESNPEAIPPSLPISWLEPGTVEFPSYSITRLTLNKP